MTEADVPAVRYKPRSVPILSRCEIIALDHHQALLMAKDRIVVLDGWLLT